MFYDYEYLNRKTFFAAEKLEQAENQLAHSRFGPLIAPAPRKKEVSNCFSANLLHGPSFIYWNFCVGVFPLDYWSFSSCSFEIKGGNNFLMITTFLGV